MGVQCLEDDCSIRQHHSEYAGLVSLIWTVDLTQQHISLSSAILHSKPYHLSLLLLLWNSMENAQTECTFVTSRQTV